MRGVAPLEDRFRDVIASHGSLSGGARVLVAASGGLDSTALLHLVHFSLPEPLDVVVAHFDHALREESGSDAAWLQGVCTAWRLPLRTARAESPPSSESDARRARYDFLERVRAEEGAVAVLVAHHADDQAETVLHRVLRGTGIDGLAAIPEQREPGIFRPFLDVWREEIAAYAERVGLGWREDPSNEELTFARNALRHRVLPDAERLVSSGARRALVRLAELAADDAEAWVAVMERLVPTLEVERGERGVTFSRAPFLALDSSLHARVLRTLAGRVGLVLEEPGTRLAVEFSSSGRSGSGIDLGGGFELRRELDRFMLTRPVPAKPDRALCIAGEGGGRGAVLLGGAEIRVSWGTADAESHRWRERLRVRADRFPLIVRAREPGDRIRLPAGSKKLKKVLLEARIPSVDRDRIPVVVDAAGEVLWVPGIATSVVDGEEPGAIELPIGMG